MADRKPAKGRVLVVDDETYVRESLGAMLAARGFDVSLASGVAGAIESLSRVPVDVVLTDLKMPGAGGQELVRHLGAAADRVPVVVLTGHGTVASAVECVRAGAADYILKPADPAALEVSLEKAIATRELRREVDYLRRSGAIEPDAAEDGDLPTGRSEAWLRVVGMVRAAAPTDSTLLLLGESGTGKELLARMAHRRSARAKGPYIRVNCAAVPLEMWESEFFGHRRGSFTGASADREGRFRLAHQGTLFMDEVGLMPPAAQAKILRVLEEGEFDRLGDEQPTRVSVRIVAATNSDLSVETASGRFRKDLLYRLDVVRVEVPPLRQRTGDIPLLVERFVQEISARLGRMAPRVTDRVLDEMQAYSWPGNVRELRNVIERALILNPGELLEPPDLARHLEVTSDADADAGQAAGDLNLRSVMGRQEKALLVEALRRCSGVRKDAARLLGIDQRNLGYYLRKHGVDPDRLDD